MDSCVLDEADDLVGIDIAKLTFHLVALDPHGKVVVRKKFSRQQLLAYTAKLSTALIGMEACSGAHFLGAALRGQGHDVRLIPAQFVKPFLKSNKNDFLDAKAIAEAVTRRNMRFVPIKTDDQLDLQALHRVRDRLVQRCTAVINQIRGFLLERGITFAQGPATLRRHLPSLLEDADQNLTPRMRHLLACIWQKWKQLESERVSNDINAIAEQDPACQRLRRALLPAINREKFASDSAFALIDGYICADCSSPNLLLAVLRRTIHYRIYEVVGLVKYTPIQRRPWGCQGRP